VIFVRTLDVMVGLVPAIRAPMRRMTAWMPGTSPGIAGLKDYAVCSETNRYGA
jgi:hypothetical protein